MIIPPFLKTGDRIWIVSPAGKVSAEKVMPGIELLREEGFEVLVGEHVFSEYFQFAGTDHQRAADLQHALNDQDAKAIICARGGYGSAKLLEYLDFSAIKNSPKWLVGFSDVTVLHSVFNQLGIASIHAAMPGSYMQGRGRSVNFIRLVQVLKGKALSYDMEISGMNRNGVVNAELVGGNLSLLYSLNGTSYDLQTAGKILFIEDLSEYLYHFDRMLMSLRLSGKLENLAGLLIGIFTSMKDNDAPFGKSVEEIIYDAVRDYDFPVCFNFPAGHIDFNMPLIFGVKYRLSVGSVCNLKMLGNG